MPKIFIYDNSPIRLDSMSLLVSSFSGCTVLSKSHTYPNLFNEINRQSADVIMHFSDKCDEEVLAFLDTYKKNPRSGKLILITSYVSKWLVKHMKHFDVKAYVSMRGKSSNLESAIEAVVEGKRYCCPEVSSTIMDYFVDDSGPELTSREREIVRLLANDMLTKEIASELSISVNTVESHRKSLIRKFDVRSTTGIVKKAIEFGIV